MIKLQGIAIIMIIFGYLVCKSEGLPYGFTNEPNAKATATITISGEVEEVVPEVDFTSENALLLGQVEPGRFRIYPNPSNNDLAQEYIPNVLVRVNCGIGYDLNLNGTFDVDGDMDDCLLTYRYAISHIENGTASIPINSMQGPSTNPNLSSSLNAINGLFEFYLIVTKFAVNPGAPAGGRLFNLTLTFSYPETTTTGP